MKKQYPIKVIEDQKLNVILIEVEYNPTNWIEIAINDNFEVLFTQLYKDAPHELESYEVPYLNYMPEDEFFQLSLAWDNDIPIYLVQEVHKRIPQIMAVDRQMKGYGFSQKIEIEDF